MIPPLALYDIYIEIPVSADTSELEHFRIDNDPISSTRRIGIDHLWRAVNSDVNRPTCHLCLRSNVPGVSSILC